MASDPKFQRQLAQLESDWATWVLSLFPNYITAPFAPHHVDFWEWVWSIEPSVRPRPFIGVWPRGGGKSFSAAAAILSLGARGYRNYCVYVSRSQAQADKHLADDIAPRLESADFAAWYPKMAEAAVTKYGQHKGWRRNRIHTASGFVVDALGMDVASRGMRVEEFRPDVLCFDDLDEPTDTPAIIARKISTLTNSILPACTPTAVIIGIQNLIHADSIFSQITDGRAEFLYDRILSGPLPALRNFQYEFRVQEDGRAIPTIIDGDPTWDGYGIEECQAELIKVGVTAFKRELQQETPQPTGGMYDDVQFRHAHWEKDSCGVSAGSSDSPDSSSCTGQHVPHLDKIACWLDPAVTDTDESDCCAIQIDGIARDGLLYRLYSWEQRTSPQRAVQHAFIKALEYGAAYVGIEIDHGHDLWKSVVREQKNALGPKFSHIGTRSTKAASAHASKVGRSGQMLADYERGLIVHVEGTHHILESALIRFPRSKPFDLVDASYHSWFDLRKLSRRGELYSAAGKSLPGRQEPVGDPKRLRGIKGRRRLQVVKMPESKAE